jgi:hypothetical protein
MKKDGEVVYIDEVDDFGEFGVVKEGHGGLGISLFADDKEQAIKIANEKRLKYLLEITGNLKD